VLLLCDRRRLQVLGVLYEKRFGQHPSTLGVDGAGFRLSASKSHWGTCGKNQVIRMHWRLVQVPLAAMAYVVAHEVAEAVSAARVGHASGGGYPDTAALVRGLSLRRTPYLEPS
jgi:hypothetical protein